MANWVNAIIDQIDTEIKARFNTKLSAIDATLETVPNAQIYKSRQNFNTKTPIIQTFLSDSEFLDNGLISHRQQALWSIVTSVRLIDVNPAESDGNRVHVYAEALHKSIYDSTNPGKLTGIVCRILPVSWIVNEEAGERNLLVREIGILWLVDHTYQPRE